MIQALSLQIALLCGRSDEILTEESYHFNVMAWRSFSIISFQTLSISLKRICLSGGVSDKTLLRFQLLSHCTSSLQKMSVIADYSPTFHTTGNFPLILDDAMLTNI